LSRIRTSSADTYRASPRLVRDHALSQTPQVARIQLYVSEPECRLDVVAAVPDTEGERLMEVADEVTRTSTRSRDRRGPMASAGWSLL
jgi:hypothetical protein